MSKINSKDLSLYIDLPFLKSDNLNHYYKKILKNKNIVTEWNKIFENENINLNYRSIYIGGDILLLDSIHYKQLKKIKVQSQKNYEFTIEIYQNNFDINKISELLNFRVNRINYRTELTNDLRLNFKKIINDLKNLKNRFPNININIDFLLTEKTYIKDDIKKILTLVTHFSIYTVDKEIYNETLLNQYYARILEILYSQNFNQYEISNFSKIGFESKQILAYYNSYSWKGIGYFATSFYKEGNNYFLVENNKKKMLNNRELVNQVTMMAMSLKNGLDIDNILHQDVMKDKMEKLNKLHKQGKLNINNKGIKVASYPSDIIDITYFLIN